MDDSYHNAPGNLRKTEAVAATLNADGRSAGLREMGISLAGCVPFLVA